VIGVNGELQSHSTLLEARSRPHFKRTADGDLAVVGGVSEPVAAETAKRTVPKLSTRPATPSGD